MGIKVIPFHPVSLRDSHASIFRAHLIIISLLLLLVLAQAQRILALLEQARLLVSGLASADRAFLLLVMLVFAKSHHVALAAATPVVGATGVWLVAGGYLYVLCQARICGVLVGYDVSLA